MEIIRKWYNLFFKTLRYVAGPLILVLLVWKLGFDQTWNIITTTKLHYLLLAYVTFIISVLIAALNVYILLYPLKKLEPKTFLKYYFLSRVTSLVLPEGFGEFSISYFLEEEKINTGPAIAAILTDKITTIATSCFIGLIAFYYIFGSTHILTIIAYFLALIALFVFFMSVPVRRFIKRWILRKYSHYFDGFTLTLLSYAKQHKKITLINIAVTLFRILIIALAAKFMFLAINSSVPFLTLILVGGIETLSTLVPLTINGLGIKQAVGVYAFNAAGVSPFIAAGRYFIGLFIQYTFGFLTAVLIKVPDKQEPRETTKE